tara:strand:+ start:4122 stop:5243 length:1122 start_codon:yes stop_codon:yes gene_type:complete
MDPKNEGIQLDDITFDDVIGGEGVATQEIAPVEEETELVDENVEELEEEEEEFEEEEEEDDDDDEDDEEEDEEDEDEDEYEDEEEDEDEYDEEEDTVVGNILEALGYEANSDYEDTAEGLTALTKDMAGKMANEQIEEVLNKFPLVKNHLNYVLNGGQSQDFMQAYDPNMDYDTLQISESDIQSQKAILGDYLAVKGHDNDFIHEMLEDYEDSGKLFKKSEAARKALGKYQGQQRQQLMEEQKQSREEARAKQEEFWNGVADTIEDSREFAGLAVPEKEKSRFFNYLSAPVNNEGMTQRDIDHKEADMEIRLAIDYLMYTGFDLGSLIDTKARTKSTRSLKERIMKNEARVKSTRRSSKRNKNFDVDDLDLAI